MELTQIRYAIALSEEGTFTAAANRCGIAQPSLTVAIRKLELEFGHALFDRRPVQLTAFGRRVLPEFYRIVEICEDIKTIVTAQSADDPYSRPREKLLSASPPRE
jgi:LysR family transcriptional regulator, hydrogen peroxide-inducible genes activator